MEKEKEHSRFIIQRFDNYISAANTKGNFLLAFNTFLTGVIATNYSKIKNYIIGEKGDLIFNVSIITLIIISLIATVYIIKAVYPFLKSGNSTKNKYHSYIFFNSVSEFSDGKAFYESYSKQTDSDVEEDLARQAHQLSIGLKNKFSYLETAMICVYIELAILFLMLLTVVFY